MKNYNKCSYVIRFNKTIIRQPMVFASLKLQYWRQLKPKHVGAFIVIFNINFNLSKAN